MQRLRASQSIIIGIMTVLATIGVTKLTHCWADQKSPVEPMKRTIVLYEAGQKREVSRAAPGYRALLTEVETFITTADRRFRLVATDDRIVSFKKDRMALEVSYVPARELSVQAIGRTISVETIFIPLSNSGFPKQSAIIISPDSSLPYAVANTRQDIRRLKQLLGDTE